MAKRDPTDIEALPQVQTDVHDRIKTGPSASENRDITDDDERKARIAFEDANRSHKQSPCDIADPATARLQTYSGLVLIWLAFQSTGVIYGDIGTSPLYVYSSTFSSQPIWEDLVGALSIIIWSLTLIVTLKYCFIVLAADDDGQGGTFALYSLLARYTHIVTSDLDHHLSSSSISQAEHGSDTRRVGYKMERYATNDLKPEGRSIRNLIENSQIAKITLKTIGVIGISLVMADGVLTPAQSVLGAIQGIRVVNPELGTPAVVGVSEAIIVLLFLVQPFGTSRLGTAFAPIVCIWLLFNLGAGIYNLVMFDYTVLKAFSPYFAFTYLIRNGYAGWKSLGGLLLAFTGVEALFADLGAFSQRAIQFSWLFLTYPCLIIAYAGQAAFIAVDSTETAFTNPFFYTVPPGTLYFSLVIAILAAIVASQAMDIITSSFQLLSQVMRLSYFPHVKQVYTSKRFHHHIYVPLANWLLLLGTVIVTAVYNNTTSLGNAYGVCVILVTLITTFMLGFVGILVWRLSIFIVLPIFLIFLGLDGVYTSAVLVKVPEGAWFTLVLAGILASIFILWRYGKEQQWSAESTNRLSASILLTVERHSDLNDNGGGVRLADKFGGGLVSIVEGLGVFFDKSDDPGLLPISFTQFVTKFAARPRILIFFHMRPLPVPTVTPAEQYVVTRESAVGPNCYRVTLRHGYAQDVIKPTLGRELIGQVELAVAQRGSESAERELEALRKGHEAQVIYVLGKETMRIQRRKGVGQILRRVALHVFLFLRENSRTKLADLNIDADRLVEVGFVKEL
ncbi:potassium transporter [Xylariaceae sp. FL1272]|nr:potassium transporter [Xylariaceae sp. FL1272]